MNGVWQNIWEGLRTASALDQVNLVLGVAGVWLMTRRNLWGFPVNLVGVVVQGVLFFQSRLPADGTLQMFFFVTLVWGWWHWVRDKGAAPELPITVLSGRARLLTIVAATAATAAWALLIAPHTDSVMPWRDAFIAAFSVAGQVLQSRKNLEN